jgi:hypothetical protein
MNTSPRRLAAAVALAAAAFAGTAVAQDAPRAGGDPKGPAAESLTPEARYAAQRGPMLAQVGAKLESVATFAMGNKLKGTGLELYKIILDDFDPNNVRARRELGWDKKGDEWVANERKQEANKEVEDESEKKRAEFERKLKDAHVACAKLLAELGDLADKAANQEDAQRYFKKSLFLDDQNPLANERMGNKLIDGKWLSDRAVRHKEFVKAYDAALKKCQSLPVAVVNCDETTGIMERAGISPVRKYKTKNFRIESNHPDASIREVLTTLERARQFFLDLYEVPERFVDYSQNPSVFVYGSKSEEKDRMVDACDGIPADRKSFNKKFTSIAVGEHLHIGFYSDGVSAQHQSVHSATHNFSRDALGNHASWLYEGIANAVAAAIMKARLQVCFSGDGTVGGIHLENMDLDQAPALLRDLALRKKDPQIHEFVKLPSDAMKPVDIAKAWSVVMYLLERDRVQAREYLLRAGQGPGGENSKDEKVLKEYFEEFPTWKDLDEAWREWAVDVYKPGK